MSNKQLQYIKDYLTTHESKISIPSLISKNKIKNKRSIFHKINLYLQNCDFDMAQNEVYKVSPQSLQSQVNIMIKTSKQFYNKYQIYYNTFNRMLVDDLKSKYTTNMLKTTPCKHDKTGTTMRLDCWKCS